MDIDHLRRRAGLSRLEAYKLLDIHPSTWRRWVRKQNAPRAVYVLLELLGGQLPDKNWRGWLFAQGKLWGPDGRGYHPGQILSIPILKQLISELQRKNRPPEPRKRRP